MHRLLVHLEESGFGAAPRFLGLDEQGREVLTFIDGEVPSDCRSLVLSDAQLEAAAGLLRRFHDATAGSDLAADEEVVCHNDFGPWNLVWMDELAVALIDFDSAAPGRRVDDVGYAIWKHLNIGLVGLTPSEQGRRLRLMTTTYGRRADGEILVAIERAQDRMRKLIEAAHAGRDRDDALSQNRREREWLTANGAVLLGDAV